MIDIEQIVHFIRSCAVLHNVYIDDELITDEENMMHEVVENIRGEEDDQVDQKGVTKRISIMNNLPFFL